MEGTSKKRKLDLEQRLQELEERVDKLENKKTKKGTVADLHEKINSILDILVKVVVPPPTVDYPPNQDFIPVWTDHVFHGH